MTKHLPHPFRAITSRVLKRFGREEGSVLVLVAVVLPTLLLFSALGVDVARFFVHKDHLRNAADAAALAGADEFLKNPTACDQNSIKAMAASYVAKNPITPSTGAGDVAVQTNVQCPGTTDAQGNSSYVDVTVTNTNVGGLFTKIAPSSITAHARASLLQASRLGGPDILPGAIEARYTLSFTHQLVGIQINQGGDSQSLVCDGSSSTGDGALMGAEVFSGCPDTQTNSSGSCSPATSPPSCLQRFRGVSESLFDGPPPNYGKPGSNVPPGGIVCRLQGCVKGPQSCAYTSGSPLPPTNPYGFTSGEVPTNHSSQLPTYNQSDPRVVILYIVPDHSLDAPAKNVTDQPKQILGYASFYLEGWDHDKCADDKPGHDLSAPAKDQSGNNFDKAGSIWGYFMATATPSGDAGGTQPCNPGANAASATCVIQLTQ